MNAPIDLLIEARWIIPVEPAGIVLENHAVAVDKGRIVAILQQSEARQQFSPNEVKQLPHHILIPGLVNLHTHAAMTLLRGLADDLPLMEWLQKHIWPAEARHVSAQFVYDGTLIACAEMLRGGTTCFNDMYFFPKAAAQAAQAAGMRAAIGLISLDFPTAYATDAADYLAKGLAARVELRGEQSTKAVRRQLGGKTTARLAVITAVVLAVVFLDAPLGIGMVAGLVLYQIVFVINVMRVVTGQGGLP